MSRAGPVARAISRILLWIAVPGLALMLLVAWPADVVRGLWSSFSGHDVVQVADGTRMGVSLLVVLLGLGGLAWLAGLRSDAVGTALILYGWFLWVPVAVALGFGAEYGMEAILSARGYDYCTFHTTDISRGDSGTYVYVRRAVPDGCSIVQTIFPPHRRVDGRIDGFDLPSR